MNEFNVEFIRIWYCMTYDQFRKTTGFNEAGNYAESKYRDMQTDMGHFLCNCDNNTMGKLTRYASDKIANYNK